MPRCTIPGASQLDTLTETASHEYFEWATDPFPASDPAWTGVDEDHIAWERLFLGELGDLCVLPGLGTIKPADLGFVVQRQWSNKSSVAGHHPCVPANASVPFFQAIPELPDRAHCRSSRKNSEQQRRRRSGRTDQNDQREDLRRQGAGFDAQRRGLRHGRVLTPGARVSGEAFEERRRARRNHSADDRRSEDRDRRHDRVRRLGGGHHLAGNFTP